MLSTEQPEKISLPFADTGSKRDIPNESQVSITPGAASFETGFPPKTFIPLAAGGIPPDGLDFNGLFNRITAIQRYQCAGGALRYDALFSSTIGGYPKGARILNAAGTDEWINTVENNLTDPDAGGAGWTSLSGGNGAESVGFTPAGTGAVASTVEDTLNFREVNVFSYMTKEQISSVRAKLYDFNATPAFTAAETLVRLLGGGNIVAPAGGYRLDGGAASSDGFKNGVLFPDTNGDFSTAGGVSIRGEGVATILRAGVANMIVLRASRLYSGGESFMIDGAGLANVYGLGLVPESMTQTTEVTSQSFGNYHDITIENCVEAVVMQPGPTVLGTDSGGFYHRLYNLTTNLCTRAVWMKTDVTGAGNRTTRASFYSPIIKRGNAGFQIDRGTEIDIYSPNFEFINIGTSPLAVPTTILHNDPNPANIRIFGGYAEVCTRAIESIAPEHVSMYSFIHTSTKHPSEFQMGRYNTGRLTVPKLLNTAGYMNVGGEGFWGFVVDPDQNGSKTGALTINGIEKERWAAAGEKTFYGSAGNIVTGATGSSITYTFNGLVVTSALGASAGLVQRTDFHGWQNAAGEDILTLSTVEWLPRVDNNLSLGLVGFMLKDVFSKRFRPGSGAPIWTSGVGTPEGTVTAVVGSMYTRVDGSAGSTLYIKESGTGSTGWVAK